MRSSFAAGLALVAIGVTPCAAAEGRYQVVNIPEMMEPGSAKVFVLDTESGHMWTWSEQAATPGGRGGRFVIYQGQLRPGKLLGDVIASEEWGESPAVSSRD